ncbi:MAG: helix-turn-helix transcriptional regulator [Oscillospiraceae bacterium]|jgi:transcriptional regulator with XRE-family HTH domain|nr:helix-turn-helix transcriptional regulator [Oscillospiraceae bacterium]
MKQQPIQILRQLRKQSGLTQSQVADYLHIDRSTYAYYESGRTQIRVEVFLRLADLFGVSFLYLVGREDAAGKPVERVTLTMDDADYANRVTENFQRLSPEEQKLILLYRSADADSRQSILRSVGRLSAPAKRNCKEGKS